MIAITAISGTVGSALRAELKQHNIAFVGLYRSATQIEAAHARDEQARLFDYDRPATFDAALQGIDTMFLLATGFQGQAEAEISAVDAAVSAGVGKIVKQSVIAADNPDFALGRLHRQVESHIEQCDLDYVFLRPNEFMQNFDEISLHSIVAGSIHEATADAAISFVDVRDIASVARVALITDDLNGRALTLTGPAALTYTQVADHFTQVLGWPIEYTPIDDNDARQALTAAGMPGYYADYLVNLQRFFRAGGGVQVSDTVREVTGQAARDFCNYVRDYEKVFREARATTLPTARASG